METINRLKLRWGIGPSATVDLVILNTAVFFAVLILSWIPFVNELLPLLYLKPAWNDFIWQPWSLFTYIFMHAGFFHLLGNMLWLYFIGTLLEDLIGGRHINRLFVFGGLAGGLLFLFAYNLLPMFSSQPMSPMVGASGGVTAVILAAAVFSPRYTIYLFGVVPIQLRWIAAIRVVSDLLGLGDGANDGGQLAHLAGAGFGYLYVLHMRGQIRLPSLPGRKRKPIRNVKVSINRPESGGKQGRKDVRPNQDEIDAILDKINQSGYDSLSREEKETLFRASDS